MHILSNLLAKEAPSPSLRFVRVTPFLAERSLGSLQ
jgi:hypothetical protein